MKKTIIVIIGIFILNNSFSQIYPTIIEAEEFENGISKVKVEDFENKYDYKYGFVDTNGIFVVKPDYYELNNFSCGFSLCSKEKISEDDYEFINYLGTNKFNKSFQYARSFSEGFAAICINYNWGFIDTFGNIVIEPIYKEVGDFSNGFAKVVKNKNSYEDLHQWGYINKKGFEIVKRQFSFASDFCKDFSIVEKKVKKEGSSYEYQTSTYVIDTLGNLKSKIKLVNLFKEGYIEESYQLSENSFKNNYYYLNLSEKCELLERYINNFEIKYNKKNKFKEKAAFVYPTINKFHKASTSDDQWAKYGHLNRMLEWISEPIYNEVGNFYCALAKVRINDNWGFIDTNGLIVINKGILQKEDEFLNDYPYTYVSDFNQDLAVVKTDNKFGYIGLNGEWVIKPQYMRALPFNNNRAFVKTNLNEWKLIDLEGKYIELKGIK